MLLAAGLYSGAYYVAGYAVELRLKALLADKFAAGAIPDRKFVNRIFTHDLEELIREAGLRDALEAARKAEPAFALHWSFISEWSEESRYDIIAAMKAGNLVAAIEHPRDGILAWLTRLSSK